MDVLLIEINYIPNEAMSSPPLLVRAAWAHVNLEGGQLPSALALSAAAAARRRVTRVPNSRREEQVVNVSELDG